MGADLSDLSPRGDEEIVDLYTTENRHGVVEPDRGDEYMFGNKYLDFFFGIFGSLTWWLPFLPILIIIWIIQALV